MRPVRNNKFLEQSIFRERFAKAFVEKLDSCGIKLSINFPQLLCLGYKFDRGRCEAVTTKWPCLFPSERHAFLCSLCFHKGGRAKTDAQAWSLTARLCQEN